MQSHKMKEGVLGFICMVACIAFLLSVPVSSVMITNNTTNETLKGADMEVSFPTVPNLLFTFMQSNGALLNGVNSTYNWVSFDEVDNSTGTAVEGKTPVVVQSINLQDPNLVWRETVSYPADTNGNTYKNINYTATFATGEEVTFSYYYFPKNFTLDYPYINSSRVLPADSFKMSVGLTGWKAVNMSNLLLLRLSDSASPFFLPVTNSYSGFTWKVMLDIGDNLVHQELNLLSVAVVDGVPRQVNWYADFVGLTFTPEVRVAGYRLYFYYPMFTNTFFYDPDLSVLVTDQQTSSNPVGDGSSSDTTTILIAVLVPVFVVGALILLLGALVFVLFIFRKRISLIRGKLDKMSSIEAAVSQEEVPN